MNAVVKAVISENTLMRRIALNFQLPELNILVIVFLLLISALGVVYVKDLNRRLFIIQHRLQVQSEQLQAESNKLLLEQSAWAAQARIQRVAQQQLHMQIPSSANVKVIKV